MFGLKPGDHALVVSSHIDDETLGLAGTIAKMVEHGIAVHVLAVACTTAPMYGGVSDAETRAAEFDAACCVLGVHEHQVAWVNDDRAARPGSYLPELISLIESGSGPSLRTCHPHALFLPTRDSHHQDHRAVHDAAIAAARPGTPELRWVPGTVIGYDGPEDRCWRAADGARPVLVDTTDFWPAKEKALRCYASQLREDPHPRSIPKIRALDEAAGAAIGTGTAERFATYRMRF
jgi:LmbE family N-acetylglucosaminyl deacetylase